METLSITSKRPFDLRHLTGILAPHWRVEDLPDGGFVVHGPGSRAYFHQSRDSDEDDFRLGIDYYDVSFAKALAEKIADDPSLTVDNDFGTVLSGNEFVARCRMDREWNWRNDPLPPMITGTLVDERGNAVATVKVAEYAPGRFEGVVLESNFPDELVLLLREFESLANDQVFPLLDEVEEKIRRYPLFFGGQKTRLGTLQLWDEDGIHFWIAESTF